ncbi:hypothetical protein ROSINTL182_08312 [Roseburia intestinalis L1-82]|uniref:Uncharacterized protein n=1 Tax=Roseburia intestinalis L1-82 TaxID=536231 RepID=C7GEG0_9FIRM|nr:hypothetical protein ROSINTL182_08312 [Roseburia intestinalis L1-82]
MIRNGKFEIHLKNRFLTPYGILVSSYPIFLFQNENQVVFIPICRFHSNFCFGRNQRNPLILLASH